MQKLQARKAEEFRLHDLMRAVLEIVSEHALQISRPIPITHQRIALEIEMERADIEIVGTGHETILIQERDFRVVDARLVFQVTR